MGTPDFAVPCLEGLINSEHEVLAVFSQPDKPVGRKQILTPPPVKACAVSNNIPVFQPETLKSDEAVDLIKSFKADAFIVVAYGKILPESVLTAAKYGCINVHASLLPKYRGAAPIQWAVLNGDSETGVTVMQMNEGIDTGDMLLVEQTAIGKNETSAELFDRLALLGSQALIRVLDDIDYYRENAVSQPDGDFGYASKITKAMSPIDWSKPAASVHNQVRGLQSWPCAVTSLNGKILKIHKTVMSDKIGNMSGEIVDNNGVLTICCGDGRCVDILELQPEGKKKMDVKSFLAGNSAEKGVIIGE